MRFLKHGIVVSILAVSIVTAGCGKKEAKPSARTIPTSELVRMIPSDSALCLCINDLESSLAHLDAYVTAVGQQPQQIKTTVMAALGNMMGNPDLSGIDVNKAFGAFGLLHIDTFPEGPLNPMKIMSVGILIPVSDYAAFTTKSAAIVDAGSDGLSTLRLGPLTLFVKQIGNYAFLGMVPDKASYLVLAKTLSEGKGLATALGAAEAANATTRSIWLYGNVNTANTILGPKVDGAFSALTAVMNQDVAANGMQGDPEFFKAIFGFYKTLIKKVLQETEALTISASIAPDQIGIAYGVTAKANTDTARMLSAGNVSLDKSGMLRYLDDGAIMNMAMVMNTDTMVDTIDTMMELVAPLMGDTADKKTIEALTSLAKDFTASLGGPAAFTMRKGNGTIPFAASYYYAIKDEARYNKAMDTSAKLVNSGILRDLYKGMGMGVDATMKRADSTYKGVPIDTATFKFTMTGMNDEATAMINAMYKDAFDIRFAVCDGMLLYAFGGDPDADIRKMIDVQKLGGPTSMSAETKKALTLLPAGSDPNFFMTYNYVRLMQMSTRMMTHAFQAMGDEERNAGAAMVKAFDIPSTSCFVITGKSDAGHASFEIIIPKEHAVELFRCFQAMMRIEMQKAANQMPE